MHVCIAIYGNVGGAWMYVSHIQMLVPQRRMQLMDVYFSQLWSVVARLVIILYHSAWRISPIILAVPLFW